MVENSAFISQRFKEENKQLFNKYHKYETDYLISTEFKKQMITEWFVKNKNLLLKEGLTKESFKIMADQSDKRIRFRPGVDRFLQFLNINNIPLYIISAGLQDSVDALMERDFSKEVKLLKDKNLYTSIGNKLVYNDKGIHCSFGENIYTFNKGDVMKNKIRHFNKSQFLMLGDHIWDVNALDSFEGTKFTIGFANFNGKDLSCPSFSKFTSAYDLTIVNDGTFDTIIQFLAKI